MTQFNLTFQTQVNANRTYFYPVDDISKAIIKFMGRKALVPGDRQVIEAFLATLGHTVTMEILPPKAPQF